MKAAPLKCPIRISDSTCPNSITSFPTDPLIWDSPSCWVPQVKLRRLSGSLLTHPSMQPPNCAEFSYFISALCWDPLLCSTATVLVPILNTSCPRGNSQLLFRDLSLIVTWSIFRVPDWGEQSSLYSYSAWSLKFLVQITREGIIWFLKMLLPNTHTHTHTHTHTLPSHPWDTTGTPGKIACCSISRCFLLLVPLLIMPRTSPINLRLSFFKTQPQMVKKILAHLYRETLPSLKRRRQSSVSCF